MDGLPPLADVEGAPLADDEVGDHGVVDVALVSRLPRHVLAIEVAVGLEECRLGAEPHRVELADEAGREVGPVLLLIELGLDADVLEVFQHQLRLVDQDAGAVRREADGAGNTVGLTGRGHEALGLREIVLVVPRSLTELRHGQRPVLETGGDGRIEGARALGGRAHHLLAVDGQRDGLADPDVAERRTVRAHGQMTHHGRHDVDDP